MLWYAKNNCLFTIVLTEYRIDFLPHKTDDFFSSKERLKENSKA
jgi:hypothetical protein